MIKKEYIDKYKKNIKTFNNMKLWNKNILTDVRNRIKRKV